MEGAHCFDPADNCNPGTLTLPIIEYPHSEGCAVIGGYQYRGVSMPQLRGMYFYGDFCSGTIWAAQDTGGTWMVSKLLDSNRSITSFGEDENGELYISDNGTGSILRIAPSGVQGCVTLKGAPLIDRKIKLTQDEEAKQTTRTDTAGCFHFDDVVPGKKFQVLIKGPLAP